MRSDPYHEPSPAPWHAIYLSVTVLSIAVLVCVRHEFPRVSESLELATLGAIVGMFTVTSLLHWYDVNRTSSAT